MIRIKPIVTTYDGGDLHTLYVRTTELQQALEADMYLRNLYQFYV